MEKLSDEENIELSIYSKRSHRRIEEKIKRNNEIIKDFL